MKILNPRQLAVWPHILVFTLLVNIPLAQAATDNTQNAPSSLSNFILSQMADHPDLLAAQAEVQSAKAALLASDKAVYNPELELEYMETDVTTKSVGFRQTIDWGDQLGSRTAVAKAELQKAMANYDRAIQSLIRNLLTHLAENQTKNRLSHLSDSSLKLMSEFKGIAERRYHWHCLLAWPTRDYP